MIAVPGGMKVHMAVGYTDLRKGLDGLAMLVQQVLKGDPFCGYLFAFRGRPADLIKIVFWDGTGLCLFTKSLQHGASLPLADDHGKTVVLCAAQLSMLVEGIDWSKPQRSWRPAVAGYRRACGQDLSAQENNNEER